MARDNARNTLLHNTLQTKLYIFLPISCTRFSSLVEKAREKKRGFLFRYTDMETFAPSLSVF